jgi:hypothetical protein
MYVALSSSDHFISLNTNFESGEYVPGEDSIVSVDIQAGGFAGTSGLDQGIESFNTLSSTDDIFGYYDLGASAIHSNDYNTVAFIDSLNKDLEEVINASGHNHLGISGPTYYQAAHNHSAQGDIIYCYKGRYKTTEETLAGSDEINCEADLTPESSPLRNFISGFECEPVTGARTVKNVYDVRYRRTKLRI